MACMIVNGGSVIVHKIVDCVFEDIFVFQPTLFHDDRGYFMESFNKADFSSLTGQDVDFIQDNHSLSHHGVLRGMHHQSKHAQGKLLRVIHGEIFDVCIDVRRNSKTLGQWFGVKISAVNQK